MQIEAEGGAQEVTTSKLSAPVANHGFSFYGSAEDQMREIMKSYYGKWIFLWPRKTKKMNRKSFPIRIVGTMA